MLEQSPQQPERKSAVDARQRRMRVFMVCILEFDFHNTWFLASANAVGYAAG